MLKLTQTLTSPHHWTDPGPAANKRRKWLRAEEGEEGMFLETNTQDEMKTIVRECFCVYQELSGTSSCLRAFSGFLSTLKMFLLCSFSSQLIRSHQDGDCQTEGWPWITWTRFLCCSLKTTVQGKVESGVACCASVQSSRKSHRIIWIFTSLLTFLELRSLCCVGRTFCPWGVASLPTASREVCSNRKPSRRTGQSSGPGGLSSSSCPTQPIFFSFLCGLMLPPWKRSHSFSCSNKRVGLCSSTV